MKARSKGSVFPRVKGALGYNYPLKTKTNIPVNQLRVGTLFTGLFLHPRWFFEKKHQISEASTVSPDPIAGHFFLSRWWLNPNFRPLRVVKVSSFLIGGSATRSKVRWMKRNDRATASHSWSPENLCGAAWGFKEIYIYIYIFMFLGQLSNSKKNIIKLIWIDLASLNWKD